MTIKQQYEKILNGCGCIQNYYSNKLMMSIQGKCGDLLWNEKKGIKENILCPSCSAKKEVFLERCKDELEIHKIDLQNLNYLRIKSNIKSLNKCLDDIIKDKEERISQLKEVEGKK